MKTIWLALLLLLWGVVAGSAGAADVPAEKVPELRGVLADDSGKRFGLYIPDTNQTGWATVGQTVGGWKLKEYRASDDTLVLVKEGREEVLHLSESVISVYHKGSAADAEALLKAMKLNERITKGFEKNIPSMLKNLLARNGLANPTPEQLAEFQKLMAGIFTPSQLVGKMAVAMGEVYTQEELKAQTDFYATDAAQAVMDKMWPGGRMKDGDEPAVLKDFYATPLGHSVKGKQAQLETQMGKTVGPWLGGIMEAAQKTAADFVKAQGISAAPARASAPTP